MNDSDSKPTLDPPALLTLALIRRMYIPQSDRTFRRWISAGTFPKPDVKVGSKLQMWARETVERWISDQREKLSRSA